MKTNFTFNRFLLVLALGLMTGIGSLSAAMVTFSVDMNEYPGSADYLTEGVTINGTFNSWCGDCNPMTDADLDGVYEVTLDIPNDTFYEFKYTVGAWVDQEELTSGTSCTITTDGFTNRTLVLGDVDLVMSTVCYQSCEACGIDPVVSDVTFSVDMNEYDGAADYLVDGVTVNGTFNGWCGDCNPMSDDNSDGIYELTIPLEAGTYEFKYTIGAWVDQEELTSGTECTITTDGFTNRTLVVADAPVVFAPNCWASCADCGFEPVVSDVTFAVDMNNYDGAADYLVDGVTVNGTFNGWCGDCNPMSDDNSDGIYELTIPLEAGSYEFKYTIGAWVDQEMLVDGSSCTSTIDGFTNRTLTVADMPIVFEANCFGECVACSTTSAPANDAACDAMALMVDGVAVSTTNLDATPDGPQASCWSDNGVEGDVWYTFVAPASGAVDIETIDTGDNNDTQVAVYSSSDGTCTGTLTEVACNDDISADDYMSFAIAEGLTAGDTYWVQVDGWDGTFGAFDIVVSEYVALVDCPSPGAVICDNFDEYTLGPVDAQADHWGPWSAGGTVSNVSDEQAFSNGQSLKIDVGGVEDNLLLLGDETTGLWTIDWMAYVPAGATGFFNIQADPVAGNAFIYQAFLNADGAAPGTGSFQQLTETFTYPEDAWFPVSLTVDLNNATHSMSVDGNVVLTDAPYVSNAGPGPTGDITLSSINFYSIDANNTLYIDDLIFDGDADVSVTEFVEGSFDIFPNPTAGLVTISGTEAVDAVTVRNVLGASVMQVATNFDSTINLDMSALENGVYFVEMRVDNVIHVSRIIKR